MENIKSKLFQLTSSDVVKGLVMAVIAGIALPVAAAFQTPDFSIFTANWHEIADLAANGAVVGFVSYLIKNFLSDQNGQVLGKMG